MSKIQRGYKFLTSDMRSMHGNAQWIIGKWCQHDGKLEICRSGFHASEDPYDSLQYVYGPRWFSIEAKGKILRDKDKFVAREMRIVKELPTKRIAVKFAVACARHTLSKFETKYPEDDRPRKALEAAETWIQKPTKENEVAAEYAAEYAAWSAESAAEYAAWSARSAARSAAESNEIEWQRKQLHEIIKEELKNF